MTTVENPIIRGFNPDPSILRLGRDYYIACSTFEWFPGVQIHHSTDLVNWTLITRPLDSVEMLDMKGVPDSCGVWAPCLSYAKETFYLVYSNVQSFDGVWKDTPNYLTTAKDIHGPWTAPVFLSSSGFDGSLFHDDDRRMWYSSMLSDHRKGKFFGGIMLQEYSEKEGRLIGDAVNIYEGSELGKTEAPHFYKLNGYYYLILAEGGTEYGHAVTMLRSKNLQGPYELHPHNPIITCTGHPNHSLQKAGHGDFVWTEDDRCYIVFLVGRPLSPMGHCTLGRETAIAEIEWRSDGWPYLMDDSKLPPDNLNVSNSKAAKVPAIQRESFEGDTLSIHYQSLRIPMSDDWINVTDRPGYLKLIGRESLSSLHKQSLVARRVQHFELAYEVEMQYDPEHFQQMAGLVCYYNTAHYFYLYISSSTGAGLEANIIMCDNYESSELLDSPVSIKSAKTLHLKIEWKRSMIDFFLMNERNEWQLLASTNKGYILSDDYVRDGSERYRPAFTGSFVGIACQDLSGNQKPAYFSKLTYTAL